MQEVIKQGASLFGMEPDDPLGGIDGLVYGARKNGEAYVVKIKRCADAQAFERVQAEAAFVDYLGCNGGWVARPQRSPRGSLVERVERGGALYAASSYERVMGNGFDFNDGSQWNGGLFRKWGQVTGQIHRLSKAYQGHLVLPDWQDDCAAVRSIGAEPDVLARWDQVTLALRGLERDAEGYGLCHNDLHPWNFMMSGGRLIAFDFGDLGWHWFVNDIALALYWALWAGPADKSIAEEAYLRGFLDNFMSGYAAEFALDRGYLRELPLFLELRQLWQYIFFTHGFKGDPRLAAYLLKDTKTRVPNGLPVTEVDFMKFL